MKTHARMLSGLVAAVLLAGCSVLPQEAEQPQLDVLAPQITQREIYTVKRGSIESRLMLSVAFGAEKQTALYFRTGAKVKKLHVSAGQQVAAGALLAELESGTLPYDVTSAEIDLQKARLDLEKAKSRVGFTDGPSETDLQKQALSLEQTELKVQRLREQLADTRLYAPFAGKIVTVSLAEGDNAEAYKDVMVLAASGSVVARATVDDATAAKLQPGQSVDFFPNDGNATPVKGKVVSVPLVGSSARDRVAVLAPDAPSDRLAVGRNGRAEVVAEVRTGTLVVHASAVRTFNGRQFVTVVQGESRQEVAIKTGLTGDQYVEVLEGLQEGDQVVSR